MAMRRTLILIATLTAPPLSVPAFAQDDHYNHQISGSESTVSDAATAGYKAAMDKMHMDMNAIELTGNADVDFMRGMIPHHQAAINMAKVQLEYGKDPEIRKLSEAIISAQEHEIKQMQNWLAKNAPD
jgi:uncharacterized protein (DUF305 family)